MITTCVSLRSSLTGSSATPGFQRLHNASVIADNGYPVRSIWLRIKCVAISRSPRPNQSGFAPYAASSSFAFQVSPACPPPAFGVDAAAECVHTSVQIGADAQTVHPHVVPPDVDDGRDAMWAFVFLEGFTTGDSERVLNTLKETGPPADAANQYSHVHDNRA